MTVTHIVLFKWKSTAKPEHVEEACKAMLSLKQDCLHPETQQPYIISASGGENNSPENLAAGFTHGFVFEFKNATDRDYYVDADPAHLAFGKLLHTHDVLQGVQVLDYEHGVL